MKPLILQGHERSITQIKYNREGDLLFSASKDHKPNVWFSLNGERLGTFNGHNGVVWCIDVDWQSTRFMSGSGDRSLKLWDLELGKEIGSIPAQASVRTCNFSFSGNQAAYSTDSSKSSSCELYIIDVRNADSSMSKADPILRIPIPESKVTAMLWGPLDETVLTGHENGSISQWDLKTGKLLNSVNDHTKVINDMQMSRDGTMFVTASKDMTAKLFDTDSLLCLKCYKTERHVNSAAISPIKEHVALGGGQDAMEVTTTSSRQGMFETRFFHLVYEEEFGRVKGHFGPVNSLKFHPDGKSFATGGEDGFVRVQNFDYTYLDYAFE
ncbi:eukaryotic translation initiation factor 3 subunit I-like [Ctenocephalides felis]|uniref:eukaryotic translation initiation factor 3 subunit I-like n=1 Tax=Ctenocephalides felis TaxID=7515 RepID=UPI000E6E1F19|nr:eukaryotic translation initiation factor 3 subunit I-like [Ctenocephalides felis]XP_026468593.1 eukaryotic translation initiation factor 3 subunit I-like [Ctenocephalides felis]